MAIHIDDPFLEKLNRVLGRERFAHSCGVASVARDLAPVWGVDPDAASLAGWLHDYARPLAPAASLELAARFGLVADAFEKALPVLLHGAIGAELVRAERLCSDAGVLEAIRCHVTGSPGMDRLGMLLFAADMIEPGRNYPEVGALRRAAADGPEEAFGRCVRAKLVHLVSQGTPVHPRSLSTYNALAAEPCISLFE